MRGAEHLCGDTAPRLLHAGRGAIKKVRPTSFMAGVHPFGEIKMFPRPAQPCPALPCRVTVKGFSIRQYRLASARR